MVNQQIYSLVLGKQNIIHIKVFFIFRPSIQCVQMSKRLNTGDQFHIFVFSISIKVNKTNMAYYHRHRP